jgi:hypothetical protein
MDKLERYRKIIRKIILEYASYKPSRGDVKTEAIIDEENDHYELIHVGWVNDRRVHGSVIHLDIIDGKIWIQHDGTSWPVADALLEAGITKEEIVLGFQPPHLRQYTDFAVT